MNCSTQRRKFYKKTQKSFVTTSYTVSKLDSKLNSTQKVGRLHITTTLHQKISKEGRKKILLQVQEGAFK